ncbi:MAG TPA: hypothetical protein VI729_12235 [Anaerolineales bacterium]|nr:hypothetical protein [Anaerolineales bacterium]
MLLGLLKGDGRVGVDPEQVAGGQVADGERETVPAVFEAELSLVVGGPDVVGAVGDGLGTPGVSAAIATSRPNEAMPREDAGGGGDAREVGAGVALAEEVEEYGRAPARMSRAELEDLLDDGGVGLRRGTMGPARELVKASVADVLEAVDPLVGCLP